MTDDDLENELITDLGDMSADPLGFVRYAYEWGKGELARHSGPRIWQAETFNDIGEHLRGPNRFQPLRIAVAAGHGIGKSAFIGMISNWGLSTCEDTRIVVTANTEGQLRTKTWPEIAKWTRMAINAHWWSVPAMSIYSNEQGREKSWRADATPWSENNTEAFAGLHNEGKRIILIYDEASKIADKVWEVSDGALTDENTEIIWIAFGNPTQSTGRFRECFRKSRHLWRNRHIDSRTVEGTNKAYLDELVATHGEDSDFVKIRVRGQFPSQSAKQLIAGDDVDAAQKRLLRDDQYSFAPKILTCDPAWDGDDMLEIGLRQGLHFKILRTIAKNDNDILIANILANLEDQHEVDQVFIDNGYGTGIISAGRTMGRTWIGVWFSGASSNPACLNKRAEMWVAARDWLKEGGALDPKDEVLAQDLIGPETVPRMDGKIQLESKKDMKARGLPSPGRGDALALSFAYPVMKKSPLERMGITVKTNNDYDPYAQ